MEWKVGEDICIIGSRGSGKTVFLHNIFYHSPLAISYNLLREPGFLILSDCYVKGDLRALRKALRDTQMKRICYIPAESTVRNRALMRKEYSAIMEMGYTHGNITVVNDDLAYLTGGEWMSDEMNLVTLWGRHKNITHAYAGQRNQNIPKTMVNQAMHWCVFWIREYDANAYSKFLGADLRCLVDRLEDFEYIWFYKKITKICPKVPMLIDENTNRIFVTKKSPTEMKL